jgi:hypothetical protein
MNKYKAKPREGLEMYGRERPVSDANDPFGTLRASRWMNADAAAAAGPTASERLLKGARAGAVVSARLAVQAARAAHRAGQKLPALMPDWRSWLEARRDLSAPGPAYVRDEAKHRAILNRMSGIAPLSEP